MKAAIRLDTQRNKGDIDPRIFGGFLEHMGRAVYEGIYDPESPLSDANGFRTDVLEALRALRMPVMRYPGGNFVSNYDWTDGIGPRDQRPVRPDYAWKSIETNQVGTDEFMQWAKELGTEPMMAVNLGTRGASEAAALLEYCNFPAGTYWADKRVANGSRDPYKVKTWCLGNEMDGSWQAGHVPAEEYARRASQAGKLMKGLDPSIELVVCGSSGRDMPTYLTYDRVVLEYCWKEVDYVSAHRYSSNTRGDSAWYLAEGVIVERIVNDYAGLLAYVRGLKRTVKKAYVSFDEWNVWYKSQEMDGKWTKAPPLIEEVYNLEDALVCAQYLNAFIRNADVVKIACIAQIVNVIAPILTRRDGLLIQSIYYPFLLMAQSAIGKSLEPLIDTPTYKAGERGEVAVLDASASYGEDGSLSVFIVNRSQKEAVDVEISLSDVEVLSVTRADSLSGSDPKAANSWEKPNVIKPASLPAQRSESGGVSVRVPSLGFVAIRAQTKKR